MVGIHSTLIAYDVATAHLQDHGQDSKLIKTQVSREKDFRAVLRFPEFLLLDNICIWKMKSPRK